ncbi:hypothetical protein BD289DRAFT_111973 [Coniella lustricola]|uniref:Rhodopsin domain-containing protein n=1 Tax=Coniella lustricola TaxID=2025994 RepID=A0A2T3AG73_9PEZI|nr:hypothetical protein BD289DRAFT_111973 [Coniella lustricola]
MLIQSPSSLVNRDIDDGYLPEIWCWFGFGVMIVILRYIVRFRTIGFRNFCGDDYLMLLALALWSIDGVIVEITYYTGATMNVSPDVVELLSERDVQILQFGTKWEYLSFFTYSGLIWTLKFCTLIFYRRLKADEWRRTWLTTNRLAAITVAAYLVVILTIIFSCWPIQRNWAVRPLPPVHCTFRPLNFWTIVTLNVISDVLILSLPVPILWQLRMSFKRKLGVMLLLCSGVFMIATAVVRAAFTISSSPSILTINSWGFRETAAGLLAVNAPILVPLFKKSFWRRGPYRPGGYIRNEWARGYGGVQHNVGAPDRKRRGKRSVFELPSAMVWSKPQEGVNTGGQFVAAGTRNEATTTSTSNLTATKSETSRGIIECRSVSAQTIQQPPPGHCSDNELKIEHLPARDLP